MREQTGQKTRLYEYSGADCYQSDREGGVQMKKVLSCILAALIAVSAMAGCAKTAKTELTKSACEVTEVENVSMSISEITPTGAKLIIKDTNESPNVYGEWFAVETKSGSDWYELQPVIEDYGFNDLGYLPNENGEVTFDVDWEWLYGKLPQGTYRIIKEVNRQLISVSFEID